MESAKKLVTRVSWIRATPALNASERSSFFSSSLSPVVSCLTRSWKRYRKLWVRSAPRHIGPGIFWMGHADVRAISLKTRVARASLSPPRWNITSVMCTRIPSRLPSHAATKYKGESNFSSNARFPSENSTRYRGINCDQSKTLLPTATVTPIPFFLGWTDIYVAINGRLLKNLARTNSRLWSTFFVTHSLLRLMRSEFEEARLRNVIVHVWLN